MVSSTYNLITQIDEDNFAVFNPLSGAFDIADKAAKERFLSGIPSGITEKLEWIERGYFFNSEREEEEYIRSRYDEFLRENEKNPVQFLLIQSYSCNFGCSYCYQKGIDAGEFISEEMLRAFVSRVIGYKRDTGREVFVTLFGGEPLMSGDVVRNRVKLLVSLLSQNGIGLSVVTNGYNLPDYADILAKADTREIHVTLDGVKNIHDKRRFISDGTGSFDRIIDGMKKAVMSGMPLNVRLIIDRVTLGSLPSLAEFLDKEGFLDLPKDKFKTSLGRNYELVNEYMMKEDLFSMDEMIAEYTAMMASHPVLKKLHVPSFFGITRLVEEGEMYLPNFDSCPALKSEFVFDSTGRIYGCTASCGRQGYEMGTYHPEEKFDSPKAAEWKSRSILNIGQCRKCSVGVVCGGGCGMIAKEQNGTAMSPNCKPVKEIMDIGIRYYKKKILSMGDADGK